MAACDKALMPLQCLSWPASASSQRNEACVLCKASRLLEIRAQPSSLHGRMCSAQTSACHTSSAAGGSSLTDACSVTAGRLQDVCALLKPRGCHASSAAGGSSLTDACSVTAGRLHEPGGHPAGPGLWLYLGHQGRPCQEPVRTHCARQVPSCNALLACMGQSHLKAGWATRFGLL